MSRLFLQILSPLGRFFAWLFAVGTMALLGVFWMLPLCVQRADRRAAIMTDGRTNSWGLTYFGWSGTVLALVEFILVVGALWASSTHHLASRAIGHLVLILWAGLWTVNAFRVFADGTFGLIYIMPFFFVCTCIRAVLDLTKPSAPALAGKPDLDRVLPITTWPNKTVEQTAGSAVSRASTC